MQWLFFPPGKQTLAEIWTLDCCAIGGRDLHGAHAYACDRWIHVDFLCVCVCLYLSLSTTTSSSSSSTIPHRNVHPETWLKSQWIIIECTCVNRYEEGGENTIGLAEELRWKLSYTFLYFVIFDSIYYLDCAAIAIVRLTCSPQFTWPWLCDFPVFFSLPVYTDVGCTSGSGNRGEF